MKNWIGLAMLVLIIAACNDDDTGVDCTCTEDCTTIRTTSAYFKGVVLLHADSRYTVGLIDFIDTDGNQIFYNTERSIIYRYDPSILLNNGDTVAFKIGSFCEWQVAVDVQLPMPNTAYSDNNVQASWKDKININLDSVESKISTSSPVSPRVTFRRCIDTDPTLYAGRVNGVVEVPAYDVNSQGIIRLIDIYPDSFLFENPMRGVFYKKGDSNGLLRLDTVSFEIAQKCNIQYAVNIKPAVDETDLMPISNRISLVRHLDLNLHFASDHPEGPSHIFGHVVIGPGGAYGNFIDSANDDYYRVEIDESNEEAYAILQSEALTGLTTGNNAVYYEETGNSITDNNRSYKIINMFLEHEHKLGEH